ncbi:alpha/beta hydrolase [Vulcanisaeta distributa]|uniref:Alpha/beta hydrolase fold protein n=1 Tax=Vulcanisaeta distributa (strain DSM 14429 / JCM 11212 / NBRC 100878 / IC-017) TaxID=572478 RepID=E1QT20_VULDI|nr:alpha/beta hydrolase [Vulcanisaeta distributa]ADN50887.1 alpha/beta hydrolase fold protein [Vulcanisaeta distributa DSM 14429]
MTQRVEDRVLLGTGINAYYRCWLADKPLGIVIGVHGFAEHSGRYNDFGNYLSSNGYSLCMEDLRGHGLTAGPRDLGYVDSFDLFLNDLEEFIELMLKRTGFSSAFLFGHSMGGLIVLHYLGRISKGVRAAITSGAAAIVNVSTGSWLMLSLLNTLAPRHRLNLPINPEFLTHDKRIVEEYVNDPLVFKKPTVRILYELVRASRSVWKYIDNISVPIMMMHGGEDKIVPPRATQEVFSRLRVGDKAMKVYDGMYHEILNELNKNVVYEDVLSWLKAHT